MSPSQETKQADLEAGPVRYRDFGEGEPIVFVHGVLVDSRLWDGTAEALSANHRCILPDWPMGAHRVAMKPDADLSPPGMADTIADFLQELDLSGVTLVGNDSGGAVSQVLVTRRPERIGRLVLTNCDTHNNFPPSVAKVLPPLAKVPGAMTAMGLPMRIGALRRRAFAPFAKNPIPPQLVDSWFEPGAKDAAIRRDTAKFMSGMNKRYTLEATEKLAGFDRPTLLAWAPKDPFFKLSYAERLAETIPDATLEQIPDAGTFVALDQPQLLAEKIAAFVKRSAAVPAG
jgi:pimeloyl-ACP methyl ester carboxylesterase